MKKLVLLLFFPLLLAGCLTVDEPSPERASARIHVSPEFTFHPGMRAAVLPFAVTGHPERSQDTTATDLLSVTLAEAGFVIIDSTIFHRHDLELGALIPAGDLEAIRRQLNVELLAIGTLNYDYDNGSGSLFGRGRYFLDTGSVRLVNLATGEVVVIVTARAGEGPLTGELGEGIKRAIGTR